MLSCHHCGNWCSYHKASRQTPDPWLPGSRLFDGRYPQTKGRVEYVNLGTPLDTNFYLGKNLGRATTAGAVWCSWGYKWLQLPYGILWRCGDISTFNWNRNGTALPSSFFELVLLNVQSRCEISILLGICRFTAPRSSMGVGRFTHIHP